MNISLTRELEALVLNKVKTGMYHSSSEVIREGLRLLKEQDMLKELRLKELKHEISIGITQANQGDIKPFNIKEIKIEGKKRLKKK
ncbi:MAG: antitoxin ParD1/3/4 [Candidatus Omnitrophota bacterium]|jgi:antitoxin ParD1/3/4